MRKDLVRRGDTIIELLLAVTIFSLASIGTIVVMNRGIAISQHSLEVTTVRQQIDAQAETVRYLRDTNDPIWLGLKSSDWLSDSVMPLAMSSCPDSTSLSTTAAKSFFITHASDGTFRINKSDTSHFEKAVTYAQIDYTAHKSYGVWLQIAKAEGSSKVRAYDLYIHSCWDSVSSDLPATLGTIVRLYDTE